MDPTDANGTAFQFSAMHCTSTSGADTSSVQVFNGFTAGELVISLFLLVVLVIVAEAVLWFRLKGIKIRSPQ